MQFRLKLISLRQLQRQQLASKTLLPLLLRVRHGLGFFLLLWLSASIADVEIPKLTQHVTDLTASLSIEQRDALEAKLAAFETQKGSQIAVLILPTTQPEDIAQFSIRVADAWKIGRKKVDDGIILIVAKDDRKLRIEVGYGLEGVIPDAIAKRIISEIITPYFKVGDFAGGVNAGIDQLIDLIQGEALPEPNLHINTQVQVSSEGLFIIILFGGLIAGTILSMLMSRLSGGILSGLGSGLIAAGLLGSMAAILMGLIVFFIIAVRQHNGQGWSNGGGGGFGGGDFGGGSSGSSWSGGGGGFGGGGASGSW